MSIATTLLDPASDSVTSPVPWWLEIDDSLALGAQIDSEHLAWLAEQGFDLILNLNTPSARNYWPGEAQAVLESGMQYAHFPLDCSHLTPHKYEIFRGILAANLGRKTFVHCAMNVKSSGMAHLWRVRELGHDAEIARLDLRRTPGHEPKWESFWKSMGA
ncbi:MAG: hypothetical protein H6686_07385 [Fibrobacteria bacterium]|nr:hypothetical protein [Fibrobacteria bacterium]